MNFIKGQNYNGLTVYCNFAEDMRDEINAVMNNGEPIEKKIVEFGSSCYISVNYGSNMGKTYYYIYFYDGIDSDKKWILYQAEYYSGSAGGTPGLTVTINLDSFDIPGSAQACSSVLYSASNITSYMSLTPKDITIVNNRYIKSNGTWIPLVKTKDVLIKSNGTWIPYKRLMLDSSVTNLFDYSTLYGMFNDSNTYSTVYLTDLYSNGNYDQGFGIKTSDGNVYPYVYQLMESRSSDTLVLTWGYVFANGARYNTQPNMAEGEVIPENVSNSTEAIALARDALLQKTGVLYKNFTVSNTKSYNLVQYFQGGISGQDDFTITRYNITNTDTGRDIVVTNIGQAYVDAIGVEMEETGGLACLTGDTLVNTPNGYIPIKNLSVGDIVLSYNETSRIVEEKQIYKVYSHKPNKIYDIILQTGDIINATYSHEFYTDKGIMSVEQLKVGYNLIDIDRNYVEIVDIRTRDNSEEVYEIWVENNNNYFITDNNILSSCESIIDREEKM